jgi:hypothetical protein
MANGRTFKFARFLLSTLYNAHGYTPALVRLKPHGAGELRFPLLKKRSL